MNPTDRHLVRDLTPGRMAAGSAHLNHPVNLIAGMSTSTAVSQVSALFGNFAEAVAFGARGIRWAFSDQSPNAFERDLIEAVVVSRIDIVVANWDAYVAPKTAAS